MLDRRPRYRFREWPGERAVHETAHLGCRERALRSAFDSFAAAHSCLAPGLGTAPQEWTDPRSAGDQPGCSESEPGGSDDEPERSVVGVRRRLSSGPARLDLHCVETSGRTE